MWHERVQGRNLRAGSHDDEHAAGRDGRVRIDVTKFSALPESDHRQPGLLPQSGLSNPLADEWRVVRRQFGDLQALELADDVRLGAPDVDAVGEIVAELVLEREDKSGATQLQDVDGVFFLDDRGDRHRRRYLAHGQRDVGVRRVLAVGEHEPGRGRGGALVRHPVVVLSGHDGDSVAHEPCRAGRVGLDEDVGNPFVRQPLGETCGDRIVLREDDVPAHARRHGPGRPQADARFEPWRVEHPDEQERQHHQQEDDP